MKTILRSPGVLVAVSCLGLITAYGQQGPEMVRKAAEQGDANAQVCLGVLLCQGVGVVKNEEEGVKWFRKAAAQKNADAQYSLGVCFAQGEGVVQSEKEAVKWYRMAAEQGHASAQLNLGLGYNEGKGVEISKEEANKWFVLASARGDVLGTDAKSFVASIVESLSPGERAAGQRAATEWRKKFEASKK